MMDRNSHNHQSAGGGGYEKRDVNIGKILAYAAGGIIILVILIIFLIDFFISVREENIYEAVLKPESAPLRELRARETEELTTYRIVDADKGIYQIPIDRAMELLADESYRRTDNPSGRK